jgi:hypothetical protein
MLCPHCVRIYAAGARLGPAEYGLSLDHPSQFSTPRRVCAQRSRRALRFRRSRARSATRSRQHGGRRPSLRSRRSCNRPLSAILACFGTLVRNHGRPLSAAPIAAPCCALDRAAHHIRVQRSHHALGAMPPRYAAERQVPGPQLRFRVWHGQHLAGSM